MKPSVLAAVKGMTYKYSSIQPFEFDADFATFLTKTGLPDGSTAESIYVLAICAPIVNHDAEGKSEIFGIKPNIETKITVSGKHDPADGGTPKDVATKIIRLRDMANVGKTWIYELVSCHQIKKLSESNIENYFKVYDMTIVPRRMLNTLDYLSAALPPLLSMLPPELKVRDFIRYHTAATSTPQLVLRWWESIPPEFKAKFVGLEAIIKTAVGEPSDKKYAQQISSKAIVHTYVFLDVNDMLPKNWYQGKRAIGMTPAMTLKQLSAIYKRLGELTSSLTSVAGSTDIPSLAANFS